MSADYTSVLGPVITQFVATKRAVGYSYETAEFHLRDFDRYAALHPESRSLTGELVRGWAQTRDGEDPAVHRTRTSPIREFGKYLQSLGDTDAFVLPGAGSRKIHRYVPHFFTSQEIAAFFTACDQLRPHAAMRARHIVLPVFFRLLYCCGLRTCEARTLLAGDVDLYTGEIDITQSKGCRSRRIPVSHDVLALLRRYDTRVAAIYPGRMCFFPTTRARCYERSAVGAAFTRIWKAAGLGNGSGNRPRAYDFRHHFALSNLNRWIAAGVDVNSMLPYLSRYMGHASITSTDYYLHLVPEFFAAFSAKARVTEILLPEVHNEPQ